MKYTRDQIETMIRALPEDVRDALGSIDNLDVVIELQKKYNLHYDQMGALNDEILMLYAGKTPPQEFIRNIQKSMNITPELAQTIGAEVNEKIFKPIRETLKKIHMVDTKKEKPLVEVTTSEKEGTPPTINQNDIYREKI